MLEISLLGRPKFVLNGVPLPRFVSEKALGVLAYLILTGETQSREKLATLFWGMLPEKRAKANLRNVLYNLQQELGDYIVADRRTVAFRPKSDTWFDCHYLRANDDPERLKQLNLGAPLLEQFQLPEENDVFEMWLLREREAIRSHTVEALEKLATDSSTRGDLSGAITFLEKLTSIDLLREQPQRRLLRLRAQLGQHDIALREFEHFQARLLDEMGIAPTPQTMQLVERIRMAADGVRHNLPENLFPFFGRTQLRQTVTLQLRNPQHRLITLSGAGGMGKTRLSLELANEQINHHLNGVAFVPLASVQAEGDLTLAVAQRINQTLVDAGFIQPSEVGADAENLLKQLTNLELLLVLDNFEHVLDAALLVERLIDTCPFVTILVTSRSRLNLLQEDVINLNGLAYPDDDKKEWDQFPATTLFCAAAERVLTTFEPSAEDTAAAITLCQLVEGMPLALEMAAAQLREHSCAEIVARLTTSPDLLNAGKTVQPDRHRSMRIVFDYSWHDLTHAEQAALCGLSVFRGAFSAEAAQTIAGANPMELLNLIDRSLVREESSHNGSLHYSLHELIRQFAAEHLETNTAKARSVIQKHSSYYLNMLSERADAVRNYGFMPRLHMIRANIANIQAAWAYARSQQQWQPLFEGYHVLMRYFASFSQHEAIVSVSTRLLDQLPIAEQIPFALIAYGWSAMSYSRLGLRKQVDEVAELMTPLAQLHSSKESAFALATCANALLLSWRLKEGQAMANEARTVSVGVDAPFDEALAIHCQAMANYAQGAVVEAKGLYEQAASQLKGLNAYVYTYSLTGIGNCHYQLGQLPEAINHYQDALKLAKQEDDHHLEGLIRYNSGLWRCFSGQYAQGLSDLNEVYNVRLTRGDTRGIAVCGIAIADQSLHCRPWGAAIPYLRQSLKAAQSLDDPAFMLTIHNAFVRAYVAGNQLEDAARSLAFAEKLCDATTIRDNFLGEFHVGRGLLEAARGDSEDALASWEKALRFLRVASDEDPLLPRTLALLANGLIGASRIPEATDCVDEIMAFYAKPQNARIDYRNMIDAVCVNVLSQAGRYAESAQIKQDAAARVHSLAAQFEDEQARAFWLTAVEGHALLVNQPHAVV